MAEQWEYLLRTIAAAQVESTLSELGAKGWELVSVANHAMRAGREEGQNSSSTIPSHVETWYASSYDAFFKRRKP